MRDRDTVCLFLGPADADLVVPGEGSRFAPGSWASPALSLSGAGAPRRPRRPSAGCDLGPPGSGAGAGSSVPLPLPGSGLGSPARGRGRGRSARAGSPRLPFLVPGKSSLRGLAASRSRARCRSALARGSAAGAAPPLGAPQCRAPSLPARPPPQRPRPGPPAPCNPAGARAGPGKPRGGVGTGPRSRRPLQRPPASAWLRPRRRPRPGLPRPRLAAPGRGGGLGLLRRPRPRPGLAAAGLTQSTGGGATRSEDPLSGVEPRGPASPGPVLAVAGGSVLGGSSQPGCGGK